MAEYLTYQTPGINGTPQQDTYALLPNGHPLPNGGVNRPIHQPLFVNDTNFQNFGDPDVPRSVRLQRLKAQLEGSTGMDHQEYELKVSKLRQLALMDQAFQPQLLNPIKWNQVEQLGPIQFYTPKAGQFLNKPPSDLTDMGGNGGLPVNQNIYKNYVNATGDAQVLFNVGQ